jgi:hypothetical protein
MNRSFLVWYQWEVGGYKEREIEGESSGYILHLYMKKRRVNPVEIVLRSGERRKRENNRGGESKIYCKHIHKHHNVFLCASIIY